jgi:hypothetical protein
MQRRPKWSTVTIALGVIAVLAIASPVFGVSSSIKKAIKKEVSKQIADATGPAGPPGATGATGLPGGLSVAAINGPGTPPAGPAPSMVSVQITLTQPQKLFVIGSVSATVGCTNVGSCNRLMGLYVDGAPIDSSSGQVQASANATDRRDVTMVGVTPTMSAGPHTLKIGVTDSAEVNLATSTDAKIGTVSLAG